MGLTTADYTAQLQALLPPGLAWTRRADAVLTHLLAAFAAALAEVDSRSISIVGEADARSPLEMLPDWERVCGLPEICSAALESTLQERRSAVAAKLTAIGGNSKAYFMAMAESMGYTVEIDEFRPFLTGVNRCGDQLGGGHAVRYCWRVRVTGPRYTAFIAGGSRVGDKLGKLDRAVDLECKFNRLKPAHTRLIFSYEGV